MNTKTQIIIRQAEIKQGFLFQSLGNHEFDNGVEGLTPFIRNLTCPVLAANLILTKVPELERENNLKNYVIFNISGRSIGVVGYLTPDTKDVAVKSDVEYIEEVEALQKEVKNMKSEGVNIIIALGHSGYLKDLEIAKKVAGLSMVIGGHTNTFLWNGTVPDSEKALGPYPTYVTQISGKQVAVVQAYAYTKYLGKLHLIFNEQGELMSADGQPILLDKTIPQDPEVLDIVDRYREEILNLTKEVIGYTSIELEGLSCQHKECNLGNLITDAIVYRYAVDFKGEHWTDAPIAILQGGGIRSSIYHEERPITLTKGDLITVMPFGGLLVVVTVNGSVLLEMLEHSVENLSELKYPGEFLQVSGIKVIYDMSRPGGSRVVKAQARCWNCSIPKFTEVDVDSDYKIIMPNFLAQGGDGYSMLKTLPSYSLSYNELDCATYYIRQHSPVFAQVEDRVSIEENMQINLSNTITPSILLIAYTLL